MLPNTTLYRMADKLADGTLADFILTHKADGAGYDQIGRLLYATFGIEVTRQTLSSWCAVLEQDGADEAVGL